MYTLLSGLILIVGSINYPSMRLRSLVYIFGFVKVTANVFLQAVSVWYGPNFLHKWPRLLPVLALPTLGYIALTQFHALNREDHVPYQSRFAFLINTATVVASRNVFAMLSFLSAERGPPSTHPLLTAMRGVLRALRITDCISDLMVLRVIWERVRPTPPASLP